MRTIADNIDEYIAGFPLEIQAILEQVRASIKKAAPEAVETISYSIPAFTLKGRALIYFAGHAKHIGLYPVPGIDKGFEADYAPYKTSGKGTIQFPYDKPVPEALIAKIVAYRIADTLARLEKRNKPKDQV